MVPGYSTNTEASGQSLLAKASESLLIEMTLMPDEVLVFVVLSSAIVIT